MVETIRSGGSGHKIGDIRQQWLEYAGNCYGNAQSLMDYRKANGFMDAFEFTLEPGSEAKREINRKKEQIEIDHKESVRKWEELKDKLGWLEQDDVKTERDRIEVLAIGQRLEVCWDVGKRFGLFND
jgi:hypothetical protein